MVQLVEALHYKRECCGSSWCHWMFSLTKSFRLHFDPGVDSSSNRMSTRNISWELKWPVLWADNFTTFMCRLFPNLMTLNSWIPLELYRDCRTLSHNQIINIPAILHFMPVLKRVAPYYNKRESFQLTDTYIGFRLQEVQGDIAIPNTAKLLS